MISYHWIWIDVISLQHYIWVHGGRNHMCSLCFRLFPSLSMLERHKISCGQCHICVQCGRRYSELKYLRQHMKRANHTGESTVASTIPKASVEHLENVQQAEISNAMRWVKEVIKNWITSIIKFKGLIKKSFVQLYANWLLGVHLIIQYSFDHNLHGKILVDLVSKKNTN